MCTGHFDREKARDIAADRGLPAILQNRKIWVAKQTLGRMPAGEMGIERIALSIDPVDSRHGRDLSTRARNRERRSRVRTKRSCGQHVTAFRFFSTTLTFL